MTQSIFTERSLQSRNAFQSREYPAGTEFFIQSERTAEPGNLGILVLKSLEGSVEDVIADPRLGGSEQFKDLPNIIRDLTLTETDIEKFKSLEDQNIGLFVPAPDSELLLTMTPRYDRFTVVRFGRTIVRAEVSTPTGMPVVEFN